MDTAEILEAFYTEHAPELLQGRRGVDGALTALRRKATAKGLSGNQVDDFVFSTVASFLLKFRDLLRRLPCEAARALASTISAASSALCCATWSFEM